MRVKGQPLTVGQTFGRQWLLTAGVDIAMCALLQLLQPGTLNYTPLFALPLLLVAVLGSLRLALGTAAGVALLLLTGAAWASWSAPSEAAPRYVEAALLATAYFVMALVVNQLAARLAQEERLARRNQSAAQLQTQVNELVIETLADGVAVVDRAGIARALNPAARALLGSMQQTARVPFGLNAEPGWWPLLDLVQAAFENPRSKPVDVVIDHAAQGPRRLRVRTRLTRNRSAGGESLCVVFLHDLREMEARLRTEKLAAMGRMSTAVAHEIRNPLAAIVQANALLDEDLTDPGHKRLTAMVQQNAQRLARITEEVLDISRVQQPARRAGARIRRAPARARRGSRDRLHRMERHRAAAQPHRADAAGDRAEPGRVRCRAPAARSGEPAGQRGALRRSVRGFAAGEAAGCRSRARRICASGATVRRSNRQSSSICSSRFSRPRAARPGSASTSAANCASGTAPRWAIGAKWPRPDAGRLRATRSWCRSGCRRSTWIWTRRRKPGDLAALA